MNNRKRVKCYPVKKHKGLIIVSMFFKTLLMMLLVAWLIFLIYMVYATSEIETQPIPEVQIEKTEPQILRTMEQLETLDTVSKTEEVTTPIVERGIVMKSTAYTSRPEETSGDPCISASGDNICDLYKRGMNVVASNAFPLGTELYIDGYGQATVLDRMASHKQNMVDVYFGYDLQAAKQWGVRNVEVIKL